MSLFRNIYLKGRNRVLLGEIGFTYELRSYKENETAHQEITLYYPCEYFNDFENIDQSFDIWCIL